MTAAPVLQAQSLVAGYGGRPVLSDVSIEVKAGEVLCVIGHNGAGKSTLMRSLFGLTRPVSGKILVDGKELAHHVPRVLASHGIALMPEGRGIFPGLTVREIFDLALWSGSIAEAERPKRIDWVLNLLPPIKGFYEKRAGFLSGGQQQMVSIGRTLLVAAALPDDGRAVDRTCAEAVPGHAAADPRAAARKQHGGDPGRAERA